MGKGINEQAPVIESKYSKVLIEKIINVNAFDLEDTLEIYEGFLDTDAEHRHDSSITSFGIHVEGKFFPSRLEVWLHKLMVEKGTDLYRSKGIISILGSDEKYVFQAVHMIMNFGPSSKFGMNHAKWREGEERISKFCFIGKNLNKAEMIADLKKCIFDGKLPEPGPVPKMQLTYKKGDRVQCNCGS